VVRRAAFERELVGRLNLRLACPRRAGKPAGIVPTGRRTKLKAT